MNHLHTFLEDRKLERTQAANVAKRYNRRYGTNAVITVTGTDTIERSKRVSMRDILKAYGVRG